MNLSRLQPPATAHAWRLLMPGVLPKAASAAFCAGLCAALAVSSSANADMGLWDAGLMDGSWRTEYADASVGTPAAPLDYPPWCAFPDTQFAFCRPNHAPIPGLGAQPATAFSRSNWRGQLHNDAGLFWVVGANVEPALDALCNSGPPNQSEPVVEPFEGIFGLRVQPARDGHRRYRNEAVLAVDLSHRPRQLQARPDCQTRDYIPFLGFGVASERGGGGAPLAMLDQGETPLLRFNYRLVDSNAPMFDSADPLPHPARGQQSGLYVEAQWGGKRRWVWIDLINTYARPAPSYLAPWNWGIRESFHFPGAEIVVTSGPSLRAECGDEGFELPDTAPGVYADRQPRALSIDLERLYDCIGDLFSTPYAVAETPVELTGLHFWVEVGVREFDGQPGLSLQDWDSRLGVAIDSIDLVPPSGKPYSSDDELITQLAQDLLGREWTPAQSARWQDFFVRQGRTEGIRAMLRHQEVETSLGQAVRLHLSAFGPRFQSAGFEASLARLRDGAGPREVARELAASADFHLYHGGRDGADLLHALLDNVLQQPLQSHPDRAAIEAAVGDGEEWRAALASGRADPGDLVLAVSRLGAARSLRQTEVDIIALYRGFLGALPDSGGLAGWRNAPQMPDSLIEALYYAPPWRERFVH